MLPRVALLGCHGFHLARFSIDPVDSRILRTPIAHSVGFSRVGGGRCQGYRRELCLCESAFASFPDERASTHFMFWGFDSPCHGASALGWFYGNSP
eukprot:g7791.t1